MTPQTHNTRYTGTAISLHWLIALAIFANLALGFYVSDLPFSPQRIRLISYHKWMGVTIFLFAVIRAFWRLTHKPPALPDSIPRWQQMASAAAHGLLYLLIVIVPLSGWFYSSAAGVPVMYFGVIRLPDLIGADKALAANLKELHEALNFILIAVVILHVLAALKHHFMDRDEILVRMLPFLKSRS